MELGKYYEIFLRLFGDFEKVLVAYLVPQRHIKAKIHMEILMMIIMKYCVWLPRLPPIRFKRNARMIKYTMVIRIQ